MNPGKGQREEGYTPDHDNVLRHLRLGAGDIAVLSLSMVPELACAHVSISVQLSIKVRKRKTGHSQGRDGRASP